MKTLMSLYRTREAGLRKSLEAAGSVDEAVGLLMKELAWLEDVGGGELTVPQQRALLAMFEVQRAALRGVKEGVRLEVVQRRRGFLRDLLAAIARMFSGPAPAQTAAQVPGALYRVRLDTSATLRHFASGLETIDRWLADQPTTAQPEDRRELLEFLQRLLGDARTGDVELLLERVEQTPQVMERYGIRFVSYDPALPPRSAEARRLFRFETSLDPRQTEVETNLPAVVQGDQVLFRGVVVEPQRASSATGR